MSKTFPLIKNALDPFYYGNGEDLEDYKKRWHYVSGDHKYHHSGDPNVISEFTFQYQSGSDFDPYTAYLLNEEWTGQFGYLREPGEFFIKEKDDAHSIKFVSGEFLIMNYFPLIPKECRKHFIPAILTHPYFALDAVTRLPEDGYKLWLNQYEKAKGKEIPLGLMGGHGSFILVLPPVETVELIDE